MTKSKTPTPAAEPNDHDVRAAAAAALAALSDSALALAHAVEDGPPSAVAQALCLAERQAKQLARLKKALGGKP